MPKKKPQPVTGYAGFASLTDYIEQRRARDGITKAQLSQMLGKNENYISSIEDVARGKPKPKPPQFVPSLQECDEIARIFGDSSHVVRVLAGRETPPPDAGTRGLADRILALSDADRDFVVRIIEALGRGRR